MDVTYAPQHRHCSRVGCTDPTDVLINSFDAHRIQIVGVEFSCAFSKAIVGMIAKIAAVFQATPNRTMDLSNEFGRASWCVWLGLGDINANAGRLFVVSFDQTSEFHEILTVVVSTGVVHD